MNGVNVAKIRKALVVEQAGNPILGIESYTERVSKTRYKKNQPSATVQAEPSFPERESKLYNDFVHAREEWEQKKNEKEKIKKKKL